MTETYLEDSSLQRDVPLDGQFEGDKVERLCRKYNLKYHLAEGVLFVSTETGNWRVAHEGAHIHGVYHQSLNTSYMGYKGRFERGYHNQRLNYKHLEDVLKYIRFHDNSARFSYSKHHSTDQLFRKIFVR